MSRKNRRIGRWATVALVAAAALALGATLPGPGGRKCVGLFVDLDAKRNYRPVPDHLTVVGLEKVPCRDAVMGWVSHGVFRAFEDGTVETLASPLPPCPQGDFYVWIRYPG